MFLKNRCFQIESLLWSYTTQRLTAEQNKKVQKHLARCPACTKAMEAYQQITPSVTALREASPPPSQANWQHLVQQIEALPNVASPAKNAKRIYTFGLFSTLAGAYAVMLYMRPQTVTTTIARPPIPNLEMAVIPTVGGEKTGKQAIGIKPTLSPTKSPSIPSKERAKEQYGVRSAFEKMETKHRDNKRSEPMIVRTEPPSTSLAQLNSKREHSLKFALDAEVPIEQTPRSFVMGSVPAGGYSIVPASYEEKELKAW